MAEKNIKVCLSFILLRDRLIQSVELPNVLGRKMRVDLKEKSVLLTTDLE